MESMRDALSFRMASKADIPGVLHLYSQPDLDDGQTLSIADAERIFARMSQYPNYKLYVAVLGGRVVGTFALLIMDNLAHLGTPSAVIEDVAVDPALQGRRIGQGMMRFALELAAAHGCYKAALSSNLKRGRAHAFYESLGFERHGYSYRIDAQQAVTRGRDKKPGA